MSEDNASFPRQAGGLITEPCQIADTFCTEIVAADKVGPCTRLVFTVPNVDGYNGGGYDRPSETNRMIICRLVIPTEALPAMIRKLESVVANRPVDVADVAATTRTVN